MKRETSDWRANRGESCAGKSPERGSANAVNAKQEFSLRSTASLDAPASSGARMADMSESLVACKTCKCPASKKASICPQCGRGRPGGGTTTGVFVLFALVVVLLAAWLIWSVMARV